MKVDDLRKPVRRRSKKYQKKDNEAGESEAKIEESKVKARKTLKADGDEIENAVAEIELEERLAKARRKHKKPETEIHTGGHHAHGHTHSQDNLQDLDPAPKVAKEVKVELSFWWLTC